MLDVMDPASDVALFLHSMPDAVLLDINSRSKVISSSGTNMNSYTSMEPARREMLVFFRN
jgi:hypothetical protein